MSNILTFPISKKVNQQEFLDTYKTKCNKLITESKRNDLTPVEHFDILLQIQEMKQRIKFYLDEINFFKQEK